METQCLHTHSQPFKTCINKTAEDELIHVSYNNKEEETEDINKKKREMIEEVNAREKLVEMDGLKS